MARIRARRAVVDGALLDRVQVTVADGRVAALSPAVGAVPDVVLVPGYLDLQVNGGGAVDVAHADPDGLRTLGRDLLAHGVTGWCPTLVTRPLDRYGRPLDAIAAVAADPGGGAVVLGAHLEGPFLGDRTGAHDADHVVDPDRRWLAALPDVVRIVTLGPERPGALDAVADLSAAGRIVSVGHTAADAATVTAAVDRGATLVTHLFNAMASLDHRRPGPVGVALTDDRLTVSLIADLVHVDAMVVSLVFRAAGGRVALVSDTVAVGAGRLADAADADGAPRRADGLLAGSSTPLDRAVANVVRGCGVPLAEAVAAASTTPARVLGLTDRGRIAVRARADLVALDGDLAPLRTWVGGEEVWAR